MSDNAIREDIVCPFCLDTGFDLIGLKIHISKGWCELYERTKDAHPVANPDDRDDDDELEQMLMDRDMGG